MKAALSSHALDQIFRSARTFNDWADRPVEINPRLSFEEAGRWA